MLHEHVAFKVDRCRSQLKTFNLSISLLYWFARIPCVVSCNAAIVSSCFMYKKPISIAMAFKKNRWDQSTVHLLHIIVILIGIITIHTCISARKAIYLIWKGDIKHQVTSFDLFSCEILLSLQRVVLPFCTDELID